MLAGSQRGLDFGIPVATVQASTLAWLQPEYSVPELLHLADTARDAVQGIQGVLRDLFERALSAVSGELARCRARYGEAAFTFSVDVAGAVEELERFAGHCVDYVGAPWEGFTFKHREQRAMRVYGVHVDGVGSLVLRVWASSLELTFCFERDVFFNDSYRDDRPVHEWPLSAWRNSCCAMQLGQAGDATVSVPVVALGARRYVVSGISYVGEHAEGQAWTVCPFESWTGKTYSSFVALRRAFDSGEMERGDLRGLLVRVSGTVCVVDGAALLVDRHASFVGTGGDDCAGAEVDVGVAIDGAADTAASDLANA